MLRTVITRGALLCRTRTHISCWMPNDCSFLLLLLAVVVVLLLLLLLLRNGTGQRRRMNVHKGASTGM
jgi:hypothetical protein